LFLIESVRTRKEGISIVVVEREVRVGEHWYALVFNGAR
jgi:hypothetical protein